MYVTATRLRNTDIIWNMNWRFELTRVRLFFCVFEQLRQFSQYFFNNNLKKCENLRTKDAKKENFGKNIVNSN